MTRVRLLAVPALVMVAALATPSARADEAQMALGKGLFLKGTTPPCGLCHTLKDAGSEGAIGPVLDEIKPDVLRVANALRNGVGGMPSFKASLTEAQIQALAVYVSTVTRR